MRKYINIAALVLLSVSTIAQELDLDQFEDIGVRSLGPAGMSGRVTTIDVVLDDPNLIYVGTASGGLWKSTSGGMDWTPIFDDEDILSIGAVAIDQNNPDIIWVGTGEGNPRNSQSSGGGLYKSIDGGRSWEMVGLEKTITIHRIIIHRDDPNTVFVGAQGSAWGPHPERGVYRTTDGGASWEQVLYNNESTGIADMIVDPVNPNKIIAAMWDFGREPHFFTSGGEGSGMYITYDAGDNWEQVTDKDGLPEGELGRMGLAISQSDPEIVYALIESKKQAIYKSTDGGHTWKEVADENVGNRPFYYSDIYVHPTDPNTIYNLWSNVTKSIDGGKTFQMFMGWNGSHPDHHAWWIHPEDPDFMINGNDGGLNITRDGGVTWRFAENLPLGQFYHINIDMDMPYNVYGGMQDNGSWKGPGEAWQWGGIGNDQWHFIMGGDGFDVVPYPLDSRYGYAMYQGGNVHWYDAETGNGFAIQPIHPDGEELRFNWNAGIAIDPFDADGVYFGSQYLHYSNDHGNSWKIISPDLTTNDTTKQKQAESGGLTIDATRAENFTTIVSIAPDPLDKNTIWVGTDDGNIQVTRDGGASWTNMSPEIKGFPTGAWVPYIECSKVNKGEVFVVVNDYRRNNWKPYVFKTTNYGDSWTQLVSDADVDGHCHAIVQDVEEPKLLFLGTERGLWFSLDAGANWQKWDKDFPSAPTVDLKIHPREHDLVIGTFGRAAWVIDDITPLREIAGDRNILDKNLHMFEPATGVIATVTSYWRFGGAGNFYGDNNMWNGQRTKFWLKELGKPDDAEGDWNWDKMAVTVFNMEGDTIRNYMIEPDTGLNVISWGMSRNGVWWPMWDDPWGEDPPSGARVTPGSYVLHLRYGSYADSAQVQVITDPRLDFNVQDRMDREQYVEEIDGLMEMAYDGFEQLKELKKVIRKVETALSLVEDSLKNEITDGADSLRQMIRDLQHSVLQPQNFEGYDHVTIRLEDHLWTARGLAYDTYGRFGDNAQNAMAVARNGVTEFVDSVNELVAGYWTEWQQKVEAMDYTLFEEYEPIGN